MVYKNKVKIDQEQLKEKVQREYEQSYNVIETKREKFRDRIRIYNNIMTSGDSGKVYVRLLYSVIDTMVALYYKDEPTVEFRGRQIDDDEIARQLNGLAAFDFEEMDMDKMSYQVQRDRFFFGVGCRMQTGWDNDRKIPIRQRVNPLSMIIDPDGYIEDHRYFGFEVMENISELEYNEDYFHLDKVVEKRNQQTEETRDAYTEQRFLTDVVARGEGDPMFDVYHHFTVFDGRKYLTSWANGRTLLIRCVEIKPELKEEKKNPHLVKFPVVLNYWKPFEYDPFGISICDLLEDKQKALQLFLNLNKIKAEHAARGDVFLYDQDAVKNINDLTLKSDGPRYVKADFTQNPDPIREVRTSSIKPDDYNMPQILQQQSFMDTGLDAQSLGVQGDRNMTATENQRIQQNANLKLMLGNKTNQRGEKKFRWLRLRSYKVNMRGPSKKNIRLNNNFGSMFASFTRKDFSTVQDIDIKIVNKSDTQIEKEQEKMAIMTVGMNTIQDPSAQAISKAMVQRKMYTVNGIPEDEAFQYVPESPEEVQAKLDLELINRDEMPADIENMQEDHMTYMIIYRRALDTPAKAKAIMKRQQAYVMSGQQAEQQAMQQQPQGGGGVANQLANSAIQQATPQKQGAASLADV